LTRCERHEPILAALRGRDVRTQKPLTRTMKISDVKSQFSSLVNEVYRKKTRILVEKSGIPVAAIVAADDLARLEQFDREWEEGTRALERFGEAFADVPPEEVEAEIARIIADIRRQDEVEAERQPA
jgi:prevent-host-death family protein